MKIRIELEENLEEAEIVIHCNKIDSVIQKVQQSISDVIVSNPNMTFFKEGKEYYFSLEEILFFETNQNRVDAHTTDDIYQVKHCLYELEKLLPSYFKRISKSTILNIKKIYSIHSGITSATLIQFYKTHKQVYVSRKYYKELRKTLNERRG